MKKIICILLTLCLLLSLGVVSFAEAPAEGTLQLIAYNVSGIPLVGGFQGSVFTTTRDRAAKIGRLLNETCVDFISVEEDFNGHRHLAAEMTNFPLRSATSGGLAQGQGLNVFSVRPIYNVERVLWNKDFGMFSGSMDAFANKGFLYCLMEVQPEVYVHMITVHCDAGYDCFSVRARADNFRQLAAFVNERLNDGRALIIQGDFNFKFKRELADDIVTNLLEPTGLRDVWADVYNNGLTDPNDPAFDRDVPDDDLDRVLYRSGNDLTLTPISKTVPALTGKNGEQYTDHNPMLTVFAYTITGSLGTPAALIPPADENEPLLKGREFLWTLVRMAKAILGFAELPYLAFQGIELLFNGKMP